MKAMTRRVPIAVLGGGLLAGLVALAMWLVGGSDHATQAQAPIIVGFDMDPAAAPANQCFNSTAQDCQLGSIENCVALPSGGGSFEFDVYLESLLPGESLLGGYYHFGEKHGIAVGQITAYTHSNPLINLWAQPGSIPMDLTAPPPLPVPGAIANFADFGAAEFFPPAGVFTQGTLGRYTLQTAAPDGLYGLTLDSIVMGRDVPPGGELCAEYGCEPLDAFDGYGLIAIGVPCPMPADIKVMQNVAAPASINVSENADVVVTKILHNNGLEDNVVVDVTKTATAPAGCTIVDVGPPVPQVVLPISVPMVFEEHYTIHCTAPSDHGPFTITNTIKANSQYISDPDGTNNSDTDEFTVAVIGHSDVKDVSYTATSQPPIHPVIGAPYIVHSTTTGIATGSITMTKVVHNNGPYGPATVEVSGGGMVAAYTGMAAANGDCVLNPPGAAHAQVLLAVSVPVNLTENYTLTCGRGGITKDDDADGMVDEDPVNGVDDDFDYGPNPGGACPTGAPKCDEDSPFYLVTIAFQDGASLPKDPHVVDDNPANNVLPGPTLVTIAVVRPFTPGFNYYGTSTNVSAQTKPISDPPPGPNKLCFASPSFGCKTEGVTRIPNSLSCAGSWPGCQPLSRIATVLGDSPGDFIWMPGVAMTLTAKAGFIDAMVNIDLIPGGSNCLNPLPIQTMLENDCLPPPGHMMATPNPTGFVPDPRCLVDMPFPQAALVPAFGGGTAGMSWSTALEPEIALIQGMICPALSAPNCKLWARYGAFAPDIYIPVNAVVFDLSGGFGLGPWLSWGIAGDPSAPWTPGPTQCTPYMTDTTFLGIAVEKTDLTPLPAPEMIKYCAVAAPPAAPHVVLGVFARDDTPTKPTGA